jgi:hypothetical protein
MAASMKMTVFWDLVLCCLVEDYTNASEVLASTSETSVNFYQTTQPTSHKTVILKILCS